MNRFVQLVTIGAALSLGAAACGGGNEDTSAVLTEVRVGYAFGQDAGDTADLLAYEALGEEGIDVETVDTGGVQAAIAALDDGSIDLAVISQSGAIAAAAAGAPVRAVLGQNMVPGFVLVARGIESPAGLDGVEVGTFSTMDVTTALVGAVEKAGGLEKGAIPIRPLGDSAVRAAALQNGRIRAAVLEEIDLIRLEQVVPDLSVLGRSGESGEVTAQVVFVALEERVQELAPVVDAVLGASETMYGPDGEATFVRLAQANALSDDSEELIREVFQRLQSIELWPRRDAPITQEQYDTTVANFLDSGQLEAEAPAFEEFWDTSLWAE